MNMKKTLIAAGVAAAMAVPAIAAADVSLTAQLQAELVWIDADGTVASGDGLYITDAMHNGNINSGNYSRFDLKGSHDLGNGLTGYAHIGMQANPTALFGGGNREILVGLGGDFGKLQLGRMGTPFSTTGKDPFHATFMQARGNGGMVDAIGGLGNGSYMNQSIGYIGSFNPVSVYAAAHLDTAPDADQPSDDTNAKHAYALRVNVDLAPVEVWVAYTGADEFEGGGDLSMAKIGAEWKSGPFRVMGQYENVDQQDIGGNDTARSGDYMMLAGSYTMGANTFMLGAGMFDPDVDGQDAQWVSLGMRHAFTRQVSVHGGVRWTEREDGDVDETVVGGGMRVVF
jgi:predicted porin